MSRPARFDSPRTRRRGYIIAGLSFLVAVTFKIVISRISGTEQPFYPLFTLAIIFSAWYASVAFGLVVAGMSTLTNAVNIAQGGFNLVPIGSQLVHLATFAVVAVVVSFIVSRWKEAEESLRTSEEKFAKAFHGNSAPMAITRLADGLYLDVNERWAEVAGYARDEMVGRTTSELKIWKRPEDQVAFVADLRRNGTVQNLECHLVTRDGQEWVALVSSQVIEIEGEMVIVNSLSDITSRKRAEELLNAANKALAEADRQKDEFIAILSHELRNPLAPIRYALPILQNQDMSQAAGRALTVIDRQVDHLTRLVDDLLDVSRITSGKIELRPEQATIGSIINMAVESASPAIAAARHGLEVVLPEEPIWVRADRARLAQVITNLLNNAARYTPRGGRIKLEAAQEGAQVVVRVADNGTGIAPENLPTVFEMFRQGDRANNSQGGLGIGLTLAKQLVEMHGGTVEARSAGVGLGSEFILRLPASDLAGGPAAEEAPTVTTAGSRRLKVLIVDDNADLVEMLGMLVGRLGHDVRTALDGGTAISAAIAYRPDVVLLDLGLPVVNGIDVARALRSRPETAHTYLVALTGWGQAEDRARTRDAGFDTHLTKPADPRTLERLLRELCSTNSSPHVLM